MELVIAAAVLALGLVAAATLYGADGSPRPTAGTPTLRPPPTWQRDRDGRRGGRRARLRAGPVAGGALDRRSAELDARERDLEAHVERLAAQEEELAHLRDEHERALERVAGLSAGQAKQALLKEVEDQARHDSVKILRSVEEETKRDAERRVRSILSVAMQRLAASHAAETTVSVVQLPSDDMKGRIIGREGRNIRALENLTGVDFIIDDTPNAVVLSAFDGVRREVARMTLEKLLQDGRIHPARIEETYYQAKSELESHITELGEKAVFEADVQGLDPELTKLLGPPALPHLLRPERPRALRRMRAAGGDHGPRARRQREDRAPRRPAARHRQGRLARDRGPARPRRRRPRAPPRRARGGRARDGGPPQRGRAPDRRGGHRPVGRRAVRRAPGARGESLEQYVKRLRDLEQIATRHEGVDKVYAMQAGREIRVIVAPNAIDDDAAILLSRAIARDIEKELEYPGQIKVTVIRESRAVDYAK